MISLGVGFMAINRLLPDGAFGPDDIRPIGDAYESVLKSLGLVDRNDPVTEIIAKKIIEIAQTGERDPQRLSDLAIGQLGIPITLPPKGR
jgi:hypothetical protein